MDDYSIFTETFRIFHEVLLQDPKLDLPSSFFEAAKRISFVGGDDKPFVLSPLKMTESSAALHALVATAGNVAAAERYHLDYQEVEVNTDLATLFLESVLLVEAGGRNFLQHEGMRKKLAKMDLNSMNENIRRYATSLYKTKDGRWYHLHGSMDARPTMKMMQVDDREVSREEAISIYTEQVAEWNSWEIQETANEQFKQAGIVAYTPEEFLSHEHGKIMSQEPLWAKTELQAPRKLWPTTQNPESLKPLAGIRVLDFSRVIAAPAVSKLLALFGADVLRVSCDKLPDYSATMPDLQTGKRDTNLDLKTEEGKQKFIELIKDADLLVDGYRPGALQKLGFDSTTLRQLNPSLIYMRENCYGFKGPWAHRSGWQQISDCLVGLSHLQGQFLGLDEAVVPLFREFQCSRIFSSLHGKTDARHFDLANSDYQTGLIGATAAIDALIARTKRNVTFDIDISLTQYNIWFHQLGLYTEEQQRDLRARDPDFKPRHSDDMPELVAKTHKSLMKIRPNILSRPEHRWKMSGAGYELDDDLSVIAPAFAFGLSKIEYVIPTGIRGRSEAKWL
jgi:hypothetical protein